MGIVSGIVVYFLTWWVMLFTVLPWGLSRDEDGTPVIPHLKRKLVVTSAVSALVWVLIYALIEADIISFREMATHMGQ